MQTSKALTRRRASEAARFLAVAAVLAHAPSAFAGIDFIAGDPVGLSPGYMVTGDFNRDGRIDAVVVSPASREVTTYLAADTPSHVAVARPMQVGVDLRNPAAGDLNGDGRLDVVIADPRARSVWILLGGGDGMFLPARQVAVPNSVHPTAVAVGNFDDIGNPDLAVADRRLGKVFILRNANGNPPCFVSGGAFDVGDEPSEIRSVDLNRDGRHDVVTLNLGGAVAQGVAVALWRRVVEGAPEFERVQDHAVGERPSELMTGDFNNDRYPDVAVLNRARDGDGNSEIRVLLNRDNGLLDPPIVVPVRCPFFTYGAPCKSLAFAPGDVDGNDSLDLIVTVVDPRRAGSSASSRYDAMQVFPGRGDGTFIPAGLFATQKTPTALAIGDVTGDGKADVIVLNPSVLQVFANGSSPGYRSNGQECLLDEECLSDHCINGVCCAAACDPELQERCNVPGREGTCLPLMEPIPCRSTESDCVDGQFCVDGFCCDGECIDGRCDVPELIGICIPEIPNGQECFGFDEDCASRHCCANFICGRGPCEGGLCEPGTGICGELIPIGATCDTDAECASGVCDVFDAICCDRRCDPASESCLNGTCARISTLPASGALISTAGPDPCGSCPSGTVRDNGVCVANAPSDDGCAIAGDRAAGISFMMLVPLALWAMRWGIRNHR